MCMGMAVASAEIRTSRDDFSGKSLVISEILNVGRLNRVELFKHFDPVRPSGIILFIKCQSTNPPYFENRSADMKIDNNVYSLDCIDSTSWLNIDNTVSTQISFEVSDLIANKIIGSNNVTVRVYLNGNGAYETFDVTPDMLNEWKQIVVKDKAVL